MQNVSEKYKNHVKNCLGLSPKSKIVVNGVEYLGNVIKTAPKFSHSNKTFIGGFPAKTVNFEIYNLENNLDFENKEIEIYKGFVIDGEIEYVKQGIFIPKAENIENNITTKVMSFKDVEDRTQYLNNTYESNLDWNIKHTGLEIVKEICNKRNITLEYESFKLANYFFKQPNIPANTTEREVLSRFAEISGEIAIFNNKGSLEIKGQKLTGDIIERKRYKTLLREKNYSPNLLVLGNKDYDNDIMYPGVKPVNSIELKIEDNPFVDLYKEEMIKDLATELLELSYIPFGMVDFIDGYYYELNDVVKIIDRNGQEFNAVILDISTNSRIKSNVKAPVKEESISNYNLAGSNKKDIREVKFQVDHNKNQIEALVSESTETKKNLQDLSTPIITKEGNNHICAYEALELNAIEYNIEGKCEQKNEPSPEYPSEIKTIKGITNLLNFNNIRQSASDVGIVCDNDGNISSTIQNLDKREWEYEKSNYHLYLKKGIYTIKLLFSKQTTSNYAMLYLFKEDNSTILTDGVLKNKNEFIYSFKLDTDCNIGIEFKIYDGICKIQIEEGSVAHSYVPYGSWLKSKVTGKNLFNKDTTFSGYIDTNGNIVNDTETCHSDFIYLEKNKPYTFSGRGTWQSVGVYNRNKTFKERKPIVDRYTPNENEYVMVNCLIENKENVMVEEGNKATSYEPYKEKEVLVDINEYDEDNNIIGYHELCSIENIKDNLEVISGHLEKNISKYIFTGREYFEFSDGNKRIMCKSTTIHDFENAYIVTSSTSGNISPLLCTHYIGSKQSDVLPSSNVVAFSEWNTIVHFYFPADYNSIDDFKAWLKGQYDSENPVVVYFKLAEPKEESLTPTEVPLFDGENHITLLEDIETDTNIKYYRENILNEAYTTKSESKAQMKITSTEIENSVTSTRTELKNDLMVTNEKFNQYALQQVLVEQINSVLQKITDSEARINILNQTITNGVPITKTETGYTFDINGLNISSTDAEVNSTLSSIGLSILDNIQKTSLLFAGYDKELQETIVRAQNMIIQKYLIVPHARFERYNNPTFGEGMGCFYVD